MTSTLKSLFDDLVQIQIETIFETDRKPNETQIMTIESTVRRILIEIYSQIFLLVKR